MRVRTWRLPALGAVVTLWATFAPCFLWIFTGAPYIERLNAEPRLRAALAAVTAAVVGVILNLTVWFALQVLFARVGEWRLGPLHVRFDVSLGAGHFARTSVWNAVQRSIFCDERGIPAQKAGPLPIS